MVQIKQMLVPASRASRVRYSGTNPKNYIVVHQTGNTSRGANANMHARLQYNGNSRSASWHEQIDGDGVIQSFSHNDMLYHAGDGRNGKGNGQGIALELCVHSDGNYNKTIENGVSRVKQLMDMYNIPIGNVINHRDCSGKWCPSQLLGGKNGITWKKFKDRVAGAKAPSESTSTTVKPSSGNKYNGSIVDYLNQQGIKSNINNRKNLAVEYGIVDNESQYTGTAKQNTDLLNAMLKGEPKQEGTRKGPIQSGYTGNSIVDYLVSIGEDASFSNRKKLADRNGIRGYAGTAKQNRDLLNKLRGGGGSSSTKAANLTVDGYLGPNTVKALQKKYGLVVDGEIWGQYSGNQAPKAFNQKAVKYGKGGSPVVKALQKTIGVTADGHWGAGTTRALQKYLGTPVDGVVSRPSTAIKELQRRLNNGTF